MKKGVKAWRGIVCCLLAVSLIVGAVPFSALNQFNYAYADSQSDNNAIGDGVDERTHKFAFLDVTTGDEKYFGSFGKDESGKYDYLLSMYGSGSYMIKAKPENEGEKIWAVQELKNIVLHAYNVKELTYDEYSEVNASSNGKDNEVYIVVGTEEPTIDTSNPRDHVIDFYEENNSVYTLGQKISPVFNDIRLELTAGEDVELSPAFDSFTGEYQAEIPFASDSIYLWAEGATPEYWAGETQLKPVSGGTKFLIGKGTDAPWDDEGNIVITIKSKDSDGEYGKEYKIKLKGVYSAPKIEVKTYGMSVDSGQKFNEAFEVEADNGGRGDLSYQWYYNGSNNSNEGGELIDGATKASYTPDAADIGDSLFSRYDYYYCVVTNTDPDGNTYSAASSPMYAQIKSVIKPEIKLEAADGSDIPKDGYKYYDQGDALTGPELTVSFDKSVAGGKGDWSYEWYEKDGNKSTKIGEGETFTIPIHEGNEYSYNYYCVVKYTLEDESVNFSSDQINISKYNMFLNPVVTVTKDPSDVTLKQGAGSANLSVTASVSGGSGKDEFSYRWQKSSDGVNFTDIEDRLDYENINGTYMKYASESSYTTEIDEQDMYYRCRIVCTSTNLSGKTFTSEPVYSKAAKVTYTPIDFSLEGKGTKEEPYLINSLQDLEAVRDEVNDGGNNLRGIYFKLTSDITLPQDWVPIGSSKDNKFCGNISGAKDEGNYLLTVAEGGLPLLGFVGEAKLSDLDIYGKKIMGNGVVNHYTVDNSIQRSIIIENVNLKSGTQVLKSGYIGGFASGVNEITIRNCTIEENVVIGYDKNQSLIGSFAGEFNGTIENCVSYADVYGTDNIGGIVSRKGQSMGYCRITNCEFYGNVVASGEHVGGIMASGYVAESAPNTPCATIKNCAVYGSVQGKDHVGGIFGGEPGIVSCWANGKGYIQDNYFGGTIISDGKYVGAIIGYMNSVNQYNVIENNCFRENCGAENGIGAIKIVESTAGDPLGKDKDKLSKGYSEKEILSGTVVKVLNGSESSFKNWAQGERGPVHSSEGKPYKLIISDGRAWQSPIYQGDGIDLTGIDCTVLMTDGSTVIVDGSQIEITGFDKDKVGTQAIRYEYGAAYIERSVTVLKRDVGEITVKFSLMGDDLHDVNGQVHTLADGNLLTWIDDKEYTVDGNSTVLDVLTSVLGENGITFSNPTGDYIESVTKDGVTLAEKDNGPNSGWMYTLNGEHVNVGVSKQYLSEGDTIVFHYTDDYTKESWGSEKTAEQVIEMINSLPAPQDLTLTDASSVSAALEAYNSLSDIEKSKISEEYKRKLDTAVLRIAELKKDSIEGFDDAYTKTAEYLSELVQTYGIQVGSIGGEWLAIGLARADVMTSEQKEAYYKNVEQYVRENINDAQQLHRSKSTDNSRVILALTAIGRDVTDVAGHNLLAGLADLDYVNRQGINGAIWALIALDSHDYEIPDVSVQGTRATRENLIASILGAQLADGGWNLSDPDADSDMTAMAIQALAPYYSTDSSVKTAVDNALQCLSDIQNSNGGYSSWGSINSESCAQVVVALTSLGIDPAEDSRFIKNGNSVLDALLGYYVNGGGFKHTDGESEINAMATEQGFYALVSYSRMIEGKSSLYDMSDIDIEKNSDSVVIPDGEGTTGQESDKNPAQAPKTSDDSAVIFWMLMALISASGMTLQIRKRKFNK